MTHKAIAAAALAAALCAGAALAEDYPKSPITLVIPLAPGDATDLAARALGDEISRELNVPVVAANHPGAGGALGVSIVVNAKKDGYTLGLANNAGLVYRTVLDPKNANYDPFKDITPLALAMRSPSILVVRSDLPYSDFAGMVRQAKSKPDSVRIGTAGVGSVGDFCVQTINALTGAGITMVPFKGASPAVAAMRGSQIDGVLLALGTMTGQLRDGSVRGIVMSTKYPGFEQIPTLAELGYKEPLFDVWAAFIAPAGVPREVTAKLAPVLEHAVHSSGIGAKLQPLGILLDYAPAEKLTADMHEEMRRVSELARKAGLIK